jgi:Putative regulator of cell autolysis
MILILLLSKPYSQSIELVKEIILPMVLGNSIGIFIFVYILRNVVKIKEQ